MSGLGEGTFLAPGFAGENRPMVRDRAELVRSVRDPATVVRSVRARADLVRQVREEAGLA